MSSGGGGPYQQEPQVQTFACPKCGHSLPVGTPICGNCGTILQGGTYVPEPLAARGVKPGAVITFAVAVALAIAGFVARDSIGDFFDSAAEQVESGTDSADPGTINEGGGGGAGGGGGGGGRDGDRIEGPRHVAELVRRMRAAGIPCSPAKVDSSDGFVETGNCQSNGQHVQINLYFRPESFAFAKEFYADWAFASVHQDNWWISGDTALMRRIHAAIGGRFTPPS